MKYFVLILFNPLLHVIFYKHIGSVIILVILLK